MGTKKTWWLIWYSCVWLNCVTSKNYLGCCRHGLSSRKLLQGKKLKIFHWIVFHIMMKILQHEYYWYYWFCRHHFHKAIDPLLNLQLWTHYWRYRAFNSPTDSLITNNNTAPPKTLGCWAVFGNLVSHYIKVLTNSLVSFYKSSFLT